MPPGGGTQIWFWQGCAAQGSKPIPIFKGHFGSKRYPFLGNFLRIEAHFSQFLGLGVYMVNTQNIGKPDPCLGIFLQKMRPRGFLVKKRPVGLAHPHMSWYVSTPLPQDYASVWADARVLNSNRLDIQVQSWKWLVAGSRKFEGGICCGGHLAVTYGGELLYLQNFFVAKPAN